MSAIDTGTLVQVLDRGLEDHLREDNRRFNALEDALVRLHARLDKAVIAVWMAATTGLGTLVVVMAEWIIRTRGG